MTRAKQTQTWSFGIHRSTAAATLAIVFTLAVAMTTPAQAQTFTVLHRFTGGADGAYPGELTITRAGNLYGAGSVGGQGDCETGGIFGCGVVFEMINSGSSWKSVPLYSFQGGDDGAYPSSVVFGPDGSLYGTTSQGGNCQEYKSYGCGTVFKLTPPFAACKTSICPWTKTLLYNFGGGNDGISPVGPLVFDQDGNLYGETYHGGVYTAGLVYNLTPHNGGWTERILHTFTGGADGAFPSGGSILDQAGNLYGVAGFGGAGANGTVFELSPSGSGWTETVLYSFLGPPSDGTDPVGGLIFDPSGNLYGTTSGGGSDDNDAGTVFMLTPTNGSWTESLLYSFTGSGGGGPYASLNMDASGALYGTTFNDGGAGSVFKLTPANGGWTETNLYEFRDSTDGGHPISNVVFDAKGNLYGTALDCGQGCLGVVWEITP
jgi:uncharacterized repeat protein (TIGR03803 family)